MLNKGREEGGREEGRGRGRGGEGSGEGGEGKEEVTYIPSTHACTHEHTQSVTLRNMSSEMTPFLRASLR